jgi:hypothetical protein
MVPLPALPQVMPHLECHSSHHLKTCFAKHVPLLICRRACSQSSLHSPHHRHCSPCWGWLFRSWQGTRLRQTCRRSRLRPRLMRLHRCLIWRLRRRQPRRPCRCQPRPARPGRGLIRTCRPCSCTCRRCLPVHYRCRRPRSPRGSCRRQSRWRHRRRLIRTRAAPTAQPRCCRRICCRRRPPLHAARLQRSCQRCRANLQPTQQAAPSGKSALCRCRTQTRSPSGWCSGLAQLRRQKPHRRLFWQTCRRAAGVRRGLRCRMATPSLHRAECGSTREYRVSRGRPKMLRRPSRLRQRQSRPTASRPQGRW